MFVGPDGREDRDAGIQLVGVETRHPRDAGFFRFSDAPPARRCGQADAQRRHGTLRVFLQEVKDFPVCRVHPGRFPKFRRTAGAGITSVS